MDFGEFPKNVLNELDNYFWVILGVGLGVVCYQTGLPDVITGAATAICWNKARSANGESTPK